MSNIDIIPKTYKQTSELYKSKLKDIETNFNIVINALLKSYPEYKLYPDVSELENIHNNNMYNLQDIKQNFFKLQKSIKDSNENIKKIINDKNIDLKKLKSDNKMLTTKFNSLNGSDQTSIGLRSQFEDEYRQKYLSLVLLMTFTLIIGFTGIKKIYELRQSIIKK